MGKHARQEATTWALVRPSKAGALLSLSLLVCKFAMLCHLTEPGDSLPNTYGLGSYFTLGSGLDTKMSLS